MVATIAAACREIDEMRAELAQVADYGELQVRNQELFEENQRLRAGRPL